MKHLSAITEARAILLDFDGPICSVFSGYPAPLIADELRVALLGHGIDVTAKVAGMSDPLAILRWTWENHPEATDQIDTMLVTAEKQAIRSALPTPHAHRAVASARRTGRRVAIVSNNSLPAITDYLRHHRISSNVTTVAARPFGNPGAMKPNPALVLQAIRRLGVDPERCVFVGDAVSDIDAGRAAGVQVVGYAKTPQHGAALASASPNCLIGSMSELADALDGCPGSSE